jgi:hypothetical protein
MEGDQHDSTSFVPDELLLLSMKVSCNTKHGTDNMVDKFWDDICPNYQNLVMTTEVIHESTVDFSPIDPD